MLGLPRGDGGARVRDGLSEPRPPAAGGGEGRGGRAGAGPVGKPGPGVGAAAARPAGGALCGREGRVAVLTSRSHKALYPTHGVWIWLPRALLALELGRVAVVGREVPGAEPSSHQEFCWFAAEDLKQNDRKGLVCSHTGSLGPSEFVSFATELLLSVCNICV